MVDIFKSVTKSKTSPNKGYNSSFNTSSSSFVDVTGLSISVPNNGFYVMKGILSIDADSPVRTASLQILQGASVVFSDSIVGNSSGPAVTKTSDSLILQNTSGSAQTVKVQLKISGGAVNATILTMSLVGGTFVLPFDSNKYATQEIIGDITSLDFVSCLGSGTLSYVSYDGSIILDSNTSSLTWNMIEKVVNVIEFFTNGSGYVAFDWAGKSIVTV